MTRRVWLTAVGVAVALVGVATLAARASARSELPLMHVQLGYMHGGTPKETATAVDRVNTFPLAIECIPPHKTSECFQLSGYVNAEFGWKLVEAPPIGPEGHKYAGEDRTLGSGGNVSAELGITAKFVIYRVPSNWQGHESEYLLKCETPTFIVTVAEWFVRNKVPPLEPCQTKGEPWNEAPWFNMLLGLGEPGAPTPLPEGILTIE
jgi:hypothetical protein